MRPIFAWLAATLAAASVFAAEPPTFSREVSRIFQQQCQTCHHPGDIGPFSLLDYQSAKPYASRIKARVTDHSMPPWKPVPGVGDFEGARILTGDQIDTIVRWVDAGAPEGDPQELPAPLSFPGGWALGQPDLVLSMPDDFTVAAGKEVYRCFSLPTGLAGSRNISAVEVRPGNRAVVHHVLLFSDPLGQSRLLDELDSGPGYSCFGGPGFLPDPSFFGGWAPGIRAAFLPPGTGMSLPGGSRIAMQVHYHPRGDAATDRTEVGIYFAPWTVDKIVRVLPMANLSFMIPAGNPHYEVKSSFTVFPGFDAHAVAIAPHMHLLGRQIEVHATYPGQTSAIPLIRIDDWDFDWQGIYQYRQPVALPGGTELEFTAYYDNSANNPKNPNSPPKDVGWGEATTDEMALVFIPFTLDSEHLAPPEVTAAGLVSAATYAGGSASPGEILALFGSGLTSSWEQATSLPLPRSLSKGLRVLVDGVEAPLFYASPTQVNFQVPFEVSASTATLTLVRSEDGARQSVPLQIAAAHPGIFTQTSDGKGAAAVIHTDGRLVTASAPAARGEWLSLYATGLGRVSPEVPSGSAPGGLSTTVNPVTVTVGGVNAEVNFAGLAPGFAGLYQVNFRVPADAPTGAGVALSLSVAAAAGNVTQLAVQ